MPNRTHEPPSLPSEPISGTGSVTLSTGLLGGLQVPGSSDQAATLRTLAARVDGTPRTYRSAWRAYEASQPVDEVALA